MSALDNLLAAAGASPDVTYIEDVFSTYLYTGNGSTQTITNGINLSGKGGMVWIKDRTATNAHVLFDTNRGATKFLYSALSFGQQTQSTSLTSFNLTGFSLGSYYQVNDNASSDKYVSWSFRESAKFFDVVTYTGNSTARTIAHNLGVAPGMMLVKRTSQDGDNWAVYHRSLGYTKRLILNTDNGEIVDSTYWNANPTASVFSLGDNVEVNETGSSYVAYLFAQDTDTNGLIQCGSYTGNGSATGPTITLGWEPQYVMIKRTNDVGPWCVFDNMRGIATGGNDAGLYPNVSDAEYTGYNYLSVTSTGFQITGTDSSINTNGSTYIYMAIRRGPMRTPTDATKVFNPVARTGTGTATTVSPGFITDFVIEGNRTATSGTTRFGAWDRLRSTGLIYTIAATAETSQGTTVIQANPWDTMDGYNVGTTSTLINSSGGSFINWMFRRAPKFFDVVCYTGTGSTKTVNHNLGVMPELIFIKKRNSSANWAVYPNSATGYLSLNQDYPIAISSAFWNDTSPTSTVFTVATDGTVNTSGTYVAYLFASCSGVSKVGTYTGTAATQTISCGFSGGARFVLIKRTDDYGNWYVWDTSRGMTSGSDKYLELNANIAEVTSDMVYTTTGGFQIVTTNVEINASGGTYIYLAIA